MDVNRLILDKTLKFFITIIIFNTVDGGREVSKSVKMSKKKFMESIGNEKIHTKLVDKYPEEIEVGIIYVNRAGTTVWMKGN